MPSSTTSSGSIPRTSVVSSRSVRALSCGALGLLLIGLATPSVAQQRHGQTAVAAGRVVHIRGMDSIPSVGAQVVLHRVGTAVQGPVDSALTDGSGRFHFVFPPDTASLFLLSTRYSGIEYFSPPVRLNVAQPDTALTLAVYDTSSAVPVFVSARHIVVSRPGPTGARSVLELLFLANPGNVTRVPRDSISPSWTTRLPADVINFDASGGDVSAQAFALRGDTLDLAATIAPGERQLIYQYGLPWQSRVVVPVDSGTQVLNVLLEEPDARVDSPGMTPADTQVIEGRTYRRWSGPGTNGGEVVLRFPNPAGASQTALIALVGTLALAVTAMLVLAVRRSGGNAELTRSAAAMPSNLPTPAALIDALARLDALHPDGGALSAEQGAKVAADRARLRSQLDAALAARTTHR